MSTKPTDTTLEAAMVIGLPLIAMLVQAVLGARASAVQSRRMAWWSSAIERGTALSLGVALVKVEALDDGGNLSFGASNETPESVSGAPSLSTRERVLRTENGSLLRIRAGQTMIVRALIGAHRNLLETVTREGGGVAQTYSFEVELAKPVWILGALAANAETEGAPFRDGKEIRTLEPLKDGYQLRGVPPEIKPHETMGCMVYPLLLICVAFGAAGELGATGGLQTALLIAAAVFGVLGALFLLAASSPNLEEPPPEG